MKVCLETVAEAVPACSMTDTFLPKIVEAMLVPGRPGCTSVSLHLTWWCKFTIVLVGVL